MTHDNTSAVIDKFRAWGGTRVHDARQPVVVLDHDVQNESPANLEKYARIEAFAREQGIVFYPKGRGIGHQVMIEEKLARPGGLVVAADSHANTYGAVGALGVPVTRSDAAAIWATGETWWEVPRTVRVSFHGTRLSGISGKDVVLALIGRVEKGVVENAAVELGGESFASLSNDERMTIANMTTEWGAIACVAGEGDPGADFAARVEIDLSTVAPFVAGPRDPSQLHSLAEIAARRIPIQKAYLLSCVNARLEDLETAAAVLRGRKVAPGVELYVSAASAQVEHDAMQRGIWSALLDAGAIPLPSGCGPCIGLGRGTLRAGETGISATNRNYPGRMGDPNAQCWIASPAVVAASAAAGVITGPPGSEAHATRESDVRVTVAGNGDAKPRPEAGRRGDAAPAAAALAPVQGGVVLLPSDDVSTDAIWPSTLTYRDDVSVEEMKRSLFANFDPRFAEIARAGDILVAGRNFGCGSSREQAVTALRAFGIRAVVGASIHRTFRRNAINNGFPVVESPALVAALRASSPPPAALRASSPAVANARVLRLASLLTIDPARSEARTEGITAPIAPLSDVEARLLAAGGLGPLVSAALARASASS
jgi:homoaconitate hydratase